MRFTPALLVALLMAQGAAAAPRVVCVSSANELTAALATLSTSTSDSSVARVK